ncbi:MAG: phenylacetate--CoA ligase family protein [Acidobacteriota bacterium]
MKLAYTNFLEKGARSFSSIAAAIRREIYFNYLSLRGSSIPRYYQQALKADAHGTPINCTQQLLIRLLSHCQRAVPYYSPIIDKLGDRFQEDPFRYLLQFPILTKAVIRKYFDQLKSADLATRKWHFNTSGGSTGEPILLIQDREYLDRTIAISRLYSKWAGCDVGDAEVYIWGSEQEILAGQKGWKAYLMEWLINSKCLNAFCMTPEKMQAFINLLNTKPPKLIVAYAQAIYELARFAERERLPVRKQGAIQTSAGTLYPFMREKIEAVFKCKVFNRYGSREVSLIAGQCCESAGLHVPPQGNYVEVVDEEGRPLPPGEDGNILVTCLTNFAMPLIRYQIGDRGKLATQACHCGRQGQILEKVMGRNVDAFQRKDGTLVDGEYFTHLLYFKDWIWKFQVIQKDLSLIIYKIIKSDLDYKEAELVEIAAKTRLLMGSDCRVLFEFVNQLPPSRSGKYRYTISEVSGDISKAVYV